MYLKEDVEKIQRAAGVIGSANDGLTQQIDNLVTLNNFAHRRWTMGHFALEPIPRDPKDENQQQSVIFHWLPVIKHSGSIKAGTHPDHEEDPANSSDMSSLSMRLHRADGKRVYSGHRIDMKTSDPENLPLPSYELLRLQWDVQRLLRLSAGAEPIELSDDSSDDDDGYGLLVQDSE